jgi:hypothetical protein
VGECTVSEFIDLPLEDKVRIYEFGYHGVCYFTVNELIDRYRE